jgi:hypothetical protein
LVDPGAADGIYITNRAFQKLGVRFCTDSSGSEYASVSDCSALNTKAIVAGDFLYLLNDYQILKKGTDPRI